MRPSRGLLVAIVALLLWSTQSLAQQPPEGGGGSKRGGGSSDGQGQDSRGSRRRGGSSDGQSQDGGGFRRRGGPPGGGPGGSGPDGGSRGGRGWGGSKRSDPNGAFDRLSGGKDVWKKSETDSFRQPFFDQIAKEVGSTNGEITRAQFVAYMERKNAKQSGAPTPAGTDPNTDKYATMAENMFRFLDKNGDGRLEYGEMPEDLRAELSKWDTNKNGTIELDEFKAYFIAKREQRKADFAEARGAYGGGAPMVTPVQPGGKTTGKTEAKKPLVYTKNNLPKDLPSWFRDLADADAQIGFFEWRAAGRSYDEFRKYDLNNDGFITVDEVLAFQADQKKKSTATRPTFNIAQGGETIAGTQASLAPAANGASRFNAPASGPRLDPRAIRGVFRGRPPGDQGGGNENR